MKRAIVTAIAVACSGLVIAAAVDPGDAPSRGSRDAPVTLVEFSDYQCPSCGWYMAHVYPQLNRTYVNTGKVKYRVMNFPIEEVHPLAFAAHQAAECARDSGRFWQMHDVLFLNQPALERDHLTEYAQQVGVDRALFDACMTSRRKERVVRRDQEEGLRIGVRATPTIILGRTEAGTSAINASEVIVGIHPFEEYRAAIERLLVRR
jgi:protein-disulfide isomerase